MKRTNKLFSILTALFWGLVATAMPKSTVDFVGTPYTILPAGTDGSMGTSGTYVLFGDWPQTIKAQSVTVDESQTAVAGGHTYYKGSDGCWYYKLLENKSNGYEGPSGFGYSDGTRVQGRYKKTYRYFKVEPIKWRVVTNNYNGSGKKLLLAECVLTSEMYNDTERDGGGMAHLEGNQYEFKTDKSLRHKENGEKIQHNSYEYSRLRAFLNGLSYIQGEEEGNQEINKVFEGKGFLQTAFTPDLQSKIAVTTVDNSRSSTGIQYDAKQRLLYDGGIYYESGEEHKRIYFPKFVSANTKDKVFVLSGAEVVRKDYGFEAIPPKVTKDNFMDYLRAGKQYKDSETVTTYKGLARPMTDFAKAHGVEHSSESLITTWWLRTPLMPNYFVGLNTRREAQRAVIVNDYPTKSDSNLTNSSIGVVPAICIN